MVYRSGKAQGRFRDLFDSCQMYSETSVLALGRPFSVCLFPFWGTFFGLFPTLLFLILRQMIFRFQPNDFSFGCERFAYMRELFVCSVHFWIFIHKKLSK